MLRRNEPTASRADWQQFFERANAEPILEVAERKLGARLKKTAQNEHAGPCPLCGGDDRFSVNTRKNIFNCRGSGGGSVIDMMVHCTGCSVIEAAEAILDEPRPDHSRDETPEEKESRLKANAKRAEERRRFEEEEAKRDSARVHREEEAVAALVSRAVPMLSDPHAKAYLEEARKLTPDPRQLVDVKFIKDADYWGLPDNGTKYPVHLATVPAVIAIIRDQFGAITGLAETFLNPHEPQKFKCGSPKNSAKKVRGFKQHGMIRLGMLGETLALSEGWENALAWDQLRGMGYFGDTQAGEDISLGAAVDLGNLAGKAAGSSPHPTEKDRDGRPTRIADGRRPDADPENEGVRIPDGVRSVIILGDYTSEVFMTASRVAVAATRQRVKGREVSIHFPGTPGLDWNDVLIKALAGEPLEMSQPVLTGSYDQRVAAFRHPGSIESYDDYMARVGFLFEPPYRTKFGALWIDELREAHVAQEWLVEKWLTVGDCATIAGPSQSGKSFLALHIALSIAHGWKAFDCPVRHCGVVYQAGEGQNGMVKRVEAWGLHHGVTFNREKGPFVLLRSPVDIYRDKAGVGDLIAEINAHASMMICPLGLVVIDTLQAATVGADEISGRDMGMVIDNVHRIARECKSAVLLVHHLNAQGNKIRGHTSLHAAMDQIVMVERDEQTKIRTVKLLKQKDEEEGLTTQFALHRVVVDADEHGKQITSCVVEALSDKDATRKEEEARGLRLDSEQHFFMKVFFEVADRYGAPVPQDWQLPAKVRCIVPWEDLKRAFESASPPDEPRAKDAPEDARAEVKHRENLRRRISRMREELMGMGVLGVGKGPKGDEAGTWCWHTGLPLRAFSKTQPPREEERDEPDF